MLGCYGCTRPLPFSKDIAHSKENGVYIRTINHFESDRDIIVEEAWIEKSWYYTEHGMNTKKEILNHYQLVFKLKQAETFAFNLEDATKWSMYDSVSGNYIATHLRRHKKQSFGVYILPFKTNKVPDTLLLHLYKRDFITKEKVGELKFDLR